MFKNFKLKYGHLIITVFVTLNIIFLAIVASSPFFANKSNVQLHAAPVCNLSGNHAYFASVAVVVKSSNPSVALPANMGLSLKTGQCTNGWDNGLPWASGYNNNYQDPFLYAPQIASGPVSPEQISAYHSRTGNAPITYQQVNSINVGGSGPNGTTTPYNCSSITACSHVGGNITRIENGSSQVTLKYYQIIDCAFSPVTYSLAGLPQGWSANPSTNTVNVVNGTSLPTYTITVTPPTPTISVTLNCNGAHWSTSNTNSNAAITGTIVNTQNNQVVANINTQTNPDSGFVSSLLTSNQNYIASMQVTDNGASDTAKSTPFNFYSCANHTPVLTVDLSCQGVSWNTSNVSSPTVSGNILNSQNQVVASINTQNQANGSSNSFVNGLEYGQTGASYTAQMTVASEGQSTKATSNSVIYSNCLSFKPTLSVSLSCNGATWEGTNLNGGSTLTGNVTDTTTNKSVYTIPQESIGSYKSKFNGSENSFVSGLVNSQNSYTASITLTNNGSVVSQKSSAVSFYNCVTHMKTPVLNTVTLSCITNSSNLGINWTYNNTTTNSTDLFYGSIEDASTNNNVVATFSSPLTTGYTWNGANTKDSYIIVGYIKGVNGQSNNITSSSSSVSDCLTPQVPVMSSISLACENNTTNNLTIAWQANNVTSSDSFNGVITDTTTGQQVYDIPNTPAQLGEYIWQGANGKDSYTITGWLVNSSGQKFNVTTSVAVSSNCIPQKAVAPIVQTLPQTSGGAPINVFVVAGLIILSIGVSVMIF